MQELWLRYLAVGGHGDVFDIDAYLHGVAPLPPFECDMLACALNERLAEVYRASCIPFRASAGEEVSHDLPVVIARLLDASTPPPGAADAESESTDGADPAAAERP